MKHPRSTEARSDEGRLHTFVMDCCFPSQGGQQGITSAGHQGNQDKGNQHILGSNQRRQ